MESKLVTDILIAAAAAEPTAGSLLAGVCRVATSRLRGLAVTVGYADANSAASCLAASGLLGSELDSVQFDLGEGPTATAVRTGAAVTSSDLSAEPGLWPIFAEAAAARGVAAVFVVPVGTAATAEPMATMTLYRGFPSALTEVEVAESRALVEAVAQVLLIHDFADLGPVFTHEQRSVRWVHVHQAVGMVTVQLGVGPADAIAAMRAHAYATGQPLEALARLVLSREYRFDPLIYNYTDGRGTEPGPHDPSEGESS